ncbi:MurR/RpiR family transcriptional regulator [Nesterenkonia populi]|uniref:MurR/RpiR family transcriptional regulator n=1 Tax=Nesterenkonia populi TaxID=1591087 RepID=UPI001478E07C|nr:MurR/RpiR family transcriptional regulator [Nesterenkonia populi]
MNHLDEHLPATTRLSSALNTLLPSETKVAREVLQDAAAAVDSTAQQLADRVGVARSTVVRTCRKLGYEGYPQFRVALARETPTGHDAVESAAEDGADMAPWPAEARRLTPGLERAMDAVSREQADRVVELICSAESIFVAANGQSAPTAMDLAYRLLSEGHRVSTMTDVLSQQIAARQLGGEDVCIVISPSGLNELSVRVAQAAASSEATLVVMTSNTDSPAAKLADEVLNIVPPLNTFWNELEFVSRLHYAVAAEVLGRQVRMRGEGESQRRRILDVVTENLVE